MYTLHSAKIVMFYNKIINGKHDCSYIITYKFVVIQNRMILDNTVKTLYNAGFGRQRLIPALYRVLNVQIASRAPCGHFRSSDMSRKALSVEAYPLELL